MDLSKLSDSDLQALQAGQLEKVSDEGLQHLHEQSSPPAQQAPSTMEKIWDGAKTFAGYGPNSPANRDAASRREQYAQAHPGEAPVQPESIASGAVRGLTGNGLGAMMPGAGGFSLSGMLSGAKDALASQVKAQAQSGEAVEGTPPLAIPAAALPAGALKLANFLNGGPIRRIGMGMAQGAASDPAHPYIGAAKGGFMGLIGEGAGGLAEKAGDATMQVAVGRNKYTPGVGTALADEGLVGTRGMMKGQVARKLEQTGQNIASNASEIPGKPFDGHEIAQNIAQDAVKLPPGGARPSSADMGKLQDTGEFLQDISNRGAEDGPQALHRRMEAGQRTYRGTENAKANTVSQLSKREGAQYSGRLKDEFRKAAPDLVPNDGVQGAEQVPGVDPEELANNDSTYGALKRAEKGLSTDAPLPTSLMKAMSFGVHHAPGGSLAASLLGQGLTKGGQAIQGINNPLVRDLILKNSSHKD
jgi:hypothetical protein